MKTKQKMSVNLNHENIEALVEDIIGDASVTNKEIFDVLSFIYHDQNLKRCLEEWKSNESPELAELFQRLFDKIIGEKSKLWENMLEIYKEYDIDKLDIGKLYQDAEEAIMEKKFQQGSKLYSVVIWALIALNRPETKNQMVKNPMHVCAFLESYQSESKKVKVASSHLINNAWGNEEMSLESVKKLIHNEAHVEFCNDCQSNVDQYLPFLYFSCLLKITECTENEEKARNSRQHLMHWMKNYTFQNLKGFFYYQEHETFQDLLSKTLEKDCDITSTQSLMNHLKEVSRQLDFQSCFQPMTSESLQDLEWILTELENSALAEPAIPENDFKIIVDQVEKPMVFKAEKKFRLQSLLRATNIAKEQDRILVKSGIYDEFKDLWLKKRSVSIFGQNETVIHDGWLIDADSTFHNLRFKLNGKNKKFLIRNGAKVKFDFCTFECSVNTLIYAQNKCEIEFNGCIFNGGLIEGQEVSARVLSLDQEDITIKLTNCYVKNFHCFLAIIDLETVYKNIAIQVENCYFEDLQDGLVLKMSPLSVINILMDKVKLELDIMDPELTSEGIAICSGGEIVCRNVVIEATHADFTGFHLNHLSKTKLENIYICGNPELVEETSIGRGISIQNTQSAALQNCCFANLRIATELISTSILKLVSIDVEKCSIGISVLHEAKLAVVDVQIRTCYYGLLLDFSTIHQPFFAQLKFQDVPKPIIAQKAMKNKLKFITENIYDYPSLDLSALTLKDDQLETELRHPLYVRFCSKEKIPFRVAYEHENFFIISRASDE